MKIQNIKTEEYKISPEAGDARHIVISFDVVPDYDPIEERLKRIEWVQKMQGETIYSIKNPPSNT